MKKKEVELKKIFAKDKEGVYLWCNENYAADFDLSVGEIFGKTDFDLYDRGLAQKYRSDDLIVIKKGKTLDIEEDYILEGKKTWVHTVKSPIRDKQGKIVGLLGVFWDATFSRQQEERLLQSEARYRAIFNISPVGIALLDKNGKLVAANQRVYDWTGYKPEEIVGKSAFDMPFFTKESRELVAENFANRIYRKDTKPYEVEYIGPNKKKRVALLEGALVFDSYNKVAQILIMFIDLTGKKATESKLEEQITQIKKINQLMIGRELKMIELKKKIKLLEHGYDLSRGVESWSDKFQEAIDLEESVVRDLESLYVSSVNDSDLSFLKKKKIKKLISILVQESSNHENNLKELKIYEKSKQKKKS